MSGIEGLPNSHVTLEGGDACQEGQKAAVEHLLALMNYRRSNPDKLCSDDFPIGQTALRAHKNGQAAEEPNPLQSISLNHLNVPSSAPLRFPSSTSRSSERDKPDGDAIAQKDKVDSESCLNRHQRRALVKKTQSHGAVQASPVSRAIQNFLDESSIKDRDSHSHINQEPDPDQSGHDFGLSLLSRPKSSDQEQLSPLRPSAPPVEPRGPPHSRPSRSGRTPRKDAAAQKQGQARTRRRDGDEKGCEAADRTVPDFVSPTRVLKRKRPKLANASSTPMLPEHFTKLASRVQLRIVNTSPTKAIVSNSQLVLVNYIPQHYTVLHTALHTNTHIHHSQKITYAKTVYTIGFYITLCKFQGLRPSVWIGCKLIPRVKIFGTRGLMADGILFKQQAVSSPPPTSAGLNRSVVLLREQYDSIFKPLSSNLLKVLCSFQ
eukprot:g59990.t1